MKNPQRAPTHVGLCRLFDAIKANPNYGGQSTFLFQTHEQRNGLTPVRTRNEAMSLRVCQIVIFRIQKTGYAACRFALFSITSSVSVISAAARIRQITTFWMRPARM